MITQLLRRKMKCLQCRLMIPKTDRATNRPPNLLTERPTDRAAGDYELIRRGFEWYAYQLRRLKKLSLKEQMEGKPGSMSAMLRDALDDYLKKREGDL